MNDLSSASSVRVSDVNAAPLRPERSVVLYWMIAARRPIYNLALERAIAWARKLDRRLLVFEPLRLGYRHASDRLHRFIVEGMRDNAAAFGQRDVAYYPYVELSPGEGKGLLCTLASTACVVVTDEYPCFFLPQMVQAAGRKLDVRLEQVDGNGVLPLRAAEHAFARAYDFRRFVQKSLGRLLHPFALARPLDGARLPRASLPADVVSRWPLAPISDLLTRDRLSRLPIDHHVRPSPIEGGFRAGRQALQRFIEGRLAHYGSQRNEPDQPSESGLSAYLHFGHVGAHQVLSQLFEHEQWSLDRTAREARGQRAGFWGLSAGGESFIDQLVTWRELGFNACHHLDGYDRYESLPRWAQQTLADHAADARQPCYPLDTFECAATHDPLWNAAQRQLLEEGRIHNYLRMLWGKKIVEWSESPRQALAIMIELNNTYALDGRDPNSYAGIFWVLGRYDRAWGPERPIFGKVRYMSSANTARKMSVKGYLQRWGTPHQARQQTATPEPPPDRQSATRRP